MQVKSFHQACANIKVFEPIAVGLIEAGEAAGILEQVLDRIALLLEERKNKRADHRSLDLSRVGPGSRSECQPGLVDFYCAQIQKHV